MKSTAVATKRETLKKRHFSPRCADVVWRTAKFIPPNGSSEDRRESRAYHEDTAISMGWPCRSWSCKIEMGGGSRPSARGWRYVLVKTPGLRSFNWIEWRKAKRLKRHMGLK